MTESVEVPFGAPVVVDPFQVTRGVVASPWKILVYGRPGIGKSTLATFAPSPLFLDLENGLSRVNCAKTPKRLTSLNEVKDWLRWFLRDPEFKTVVIDTIDELERFLAINVVTAWNAGNKKVKTVADIPYGRGGELLVAEWKEVIDIFDHITAAGKNILLIGHEQINKFENPSDDNYNFYSVNLHKKCEPVVTAKLDAVLYARYETIVKDADDGKGKAAVTGKRVLSTNHGGSFVAKNRFSLPETMDMDKSVFDAIQ
jgi:Cdc6-like AAA superfamily ATPase